jgi:hypothetical protein
LENKIGDFLKGRILTRDFRKRKVFCHEGHEGAQKDFSPQTCLPPGRVLREKEVEGSDLELDF